MFNQGQGGFQSYDASYQSPGGFGTPQKTDAGDRKKKNILPVTVAEIINSSQNNDRFYTGDIEVLQVTMVGLVRSVSENATRVDYEIDDMTGPPLEVKQFVDNDESVPEEEKVQIMRENTYVRVSGTIRSMGGKKCVVAFKMSPLTDMNEMTHHMLEVIHSHASLAKSPSQGMNGSMMAGNRMDTTSAVSNYGDAGEGMISGLSTVQNQVHLAIRNNPTAEGASIESVCKQVRGVPEKAIREAIEFLSSEGHIYSTIDDEHFKSTDS